jgi:putative ABC transport system ATP-binding protein
MTAIVSLKGIVKSYIRGKQRVEVLHGMDLEIRAGEFLALMGPSGSGKTTLLNLIGGIDRPDTGDLLVAGQQINKLTARELAGWRAHHVGFVFQFYNLMPLLTAEQNVELPLLMTDLSKAQRRANVQAALELVGLADRASHKPAELSGGQQQRVAIARALVADPALLVCDEPTGDLDREMAEQILDLLQIVNREQQKTIVMVTHDPKAAERATRRVHLDKGRLIDAQQSAAA